MTEHDFQVGDIVLKDDRIVCEVVRLLDVNVRNIEKLLKLRTLQGGHEVYWYAADVQYLCRCRQKHWQGNRSQVVISESWIHGVQACRPLGFA